MAEVEALYLIYPKFSRQRQLILVLHAFDENVVATISQKSDDIAEHGLASRRGGVMKEGAVDFYRVEVDQAKPGKARKARSEVVQPNPYPQLPKI